MEISILLYFIENGVYTLEGMLLEPINRSIWFIQSGLSDLLCHCVKKYSMRVIFTV